MTKLIVLFERIALTLQVWTEICFLTRSEFIAYRPPRGESIINPQHNVDANFTASSKSAPSFNALTTTVTNTPAPPPVNNTPAPPKYNSRTSTVEQRSAHSDNKSEKKEDKEAKLLSNLKSKVVTLELENKELKASQKKKLEEIKVKVDEAKVKAESKFEEREVKTNQKLVATESKLQNANSKIEELTKEIKASTAKFAAQSQQVVKSVPAVATNSAAIDASVIASEYLKLTSVIQNTETQIISSRLKAETSIALLREDESQKLKVFFIYINFIARKITINCIFK